MTSTNFRLSGIIPAVFTPLRPNGDLNLGLVPAVVEHLIQDGAAGLYVCGSTGEGPSLTTDERMAVAEAYIHAANRRLPVIIQVGHDSLRQAQQLAAHAQAAGADAISAVPPVYFKVDTPARLADCLAEICSAAPALPFYYYHIPRLTAARIDLLALLHIAARRLPSLTGVKYADFTIFELQACAEFDGGRYNLLFGSDEMLLAGLAGGAQGAVGTSYCFALPLYRRIFDAFQRGEIGEAQRLQSRSVQMINVLNRLSPPGANLPAMKAMMALIGLDCGPLRLPMATLTVEQQAYLDKEMSLIGFYGWRE
jgi:N-acetylneuraminate lyase